jgi:hypothetical protein
MRTSHVATTLVAVTAGLTAATALHRRSGRPLPVRAFPAEPALADRSGVVLPFVRPLAVAPVGTASVGTAPVGSAPVGSAPVGSAPVGSAAAWSTPAPGTRAAPARCGDGGGRTKAGAPCGARATAGERCHHHRLTA